jgi:GT2 family glycosyltransferase
VPRKPLSGGIEGRPFGGLALDSALQMTAPSVTVLIDTYNYGRFIERAIESVLAQDFAMEQVEILVVDDGSTDDTAERVNKYGGAIRYLHKENGGQASAFNLGFAEARSELVLLLDADDYFLPGKVRRVVEEFAKHPEVGTIYHRLMELEERSGKLRETRVPFHAISGFLPDDKEKTLRYGAHQTSSLAFRRRVLERVMPMPESMRIHADAFVELLAVLLAPVLGIDEALAVYRVHGENLSYGDWAESTPEAARRRVAAYQVVLAEVAGWMAAHKNELSGIDTRGYIEPQLLEMQLAQYLADPPGRWRSFWFMARRNYVLACLQNWRYTLFNYIGAGLALIVGYRRAQAIHRRTLGGLQGLLRRG